MHDGDEMSELLGTIGIFPTVIEPAKLVAATLSEGQLVEIPGLPGFWVSDEEGTPEVMNKVASFTLGTRTFFILESK